MNNHEHTIREGWEKFILEKFGQLEYFDSTICADFWLNEMASHTQALKEKVEGMKKNRYTSDDPEFVDALNIGYQSALDAVLALLERETQ